jgi:molybdenum cofactor biosynthesis protein B
MGAADHRDKASHETVARCAILVVSDTKTRETDTSGRAAAEILQQAGHLVVRQEIVPNREQLLEKALLVALDEADLVLTIGGTGISHKDLSVDVVRGFLRKELPGFGELFRARSVPEIGTATILSRATLGVTEGGKFIAALPGSESAVRLGVGEILVKELKHLLWELRRYA